MKIYRLNSIESDIKKEGKPVLPRKDQVSDPTKQGANRGKAIKDVNKRYSQSKKAIKQAVEKFLREAPKKRITVNANIYEYEVSNLESSQLTALISSILYRYLSINPNALTDPGFFLSSYVAQSYNAGANDMLQTAKNVSTPDNVGLGTSLLVRQMTADELITDPQYRRRVGLVAGRSFELMKGLTQQTVADLSQTLTSGMAEGQGTTAITKNIMDRIDVSKSRAQRIARTEINNAYRTASRQEMTNINEQLFKDEPYEMRMLWFSALSPTTRATHARKHGNTYTAAEVADFYSKDGNAINCLCSQTAVLVNTKTGQPLQLSLVDQMKDDKKEWAKDNEAFAA